MNEMCGGKKKIKIDTESLSKIKNFLRYRGKEKDVNLKGNVIDALKERKNEGSLSFYRSRYRDTSQIFAIQFTSSVIATVANNDRKYYYIDRNHHFYYLKLTDIPRRVLQL